MTTSAQPRLFTNSSLVATATQGRRQRGAREHFEANVVPRGAIPSRRRLYRALAMNVEVAPAEPNERTLVAGLMQPYLSEMSPHTGQSAEGNGRFRYPYLDLYFSESDRHPFVFTIGRRVIGFALVRTFDQGTAMAEFFIAPEYRGKGYGRVAAHQIFLRYPGPWVIRQQLSNAPAQTFWRRVLKQYGDGDYDERIETTKAGRTGTVQRFTA